MSETIEQSQPYNSEDISTFERFGVCITPQQIIALRKLYGRLEARPSFHEWVNDTSKVQPALGIDCIMVSQWGMWLGIEKDGYTHS